MLNENPNNNNHHDNQNQQAIVDRFENYINQVNVDPYLREALRQFIRQPQQQNAPQFQENRIKLGL